MNPIILVAVIAQTFLTKISKPIGALAGYAITTGMLVWGLGLYDHGHAVALLGTAIPKELFVVWCLFWYGYDTKVAIEAVTQRIAAAKQQA